MLRQALSPEGVATAAPPAQFLTFALGDEEYAVDVLRVQEIKGYSAVTPIPNAPHFIRGVMNLRGAVVPVIGLRETFGLAPMPYDTFSVIVVLTVGSRVIGLLVDSVADVVELEMDQIEMPPELGDRVDTSYISGVVHVGDKFTLVLSIEKILSGADILDAQVRGEETLAVTDTAAAERGTQP
jgi:purine-binding chemotaxis protein CheW